MATQILYLLINSSNLWIRFSNANIDQFNIENVSLNRTSVY